jgi:phage shock protein E
MRKLIFTGFALLLLTGAVACSSNSSTEGQAGNTPAVQTSSVEAQSWALIRAGALLVDVRTPEEFAQGHLQGAINIPYDQVEALRSEFGKDLNHAIVVYCRSGRRSGIAQDTLERLGYTSVFNGRAYKSLLAAQ